MPRQSYCLLFLVLAVGLQGALTSSSTPWPYLQIYPPVNETDDRTPLYFAVVLAFSGGFPSIGALPGVQMALDYINSQPSILPGYSLHYTLTDSQCNRSVALNSFFRQINFPPTKVGWVGSGCSVATEPTAELTHFYNITQLSCISSSPELTDRQRFKYYFQLLVSETLTAHGMLGIIANFGWKRVGIISQDENLFTASMAALKLGLTEREIEYREQWFRSDEGLSSISSGVFDPEIRIYVLAMYSRFARDAVCEAYRLGMHYPKYMLITYAWYVAEWWKGDATSSEYNCTAEERATVLPYTLGPFTREFPTDEHAEAEPGITASQFLSQYVNVVNRTINQQINLANYIDPEKDRPFLYSYHCHEATLALAYALNKTIADLNENSTLNREAAMLSGLPEGESFTIANFTYANSAVLSQVFRHLQNTSFAGISGIEVTFDEEGTRIRDKVTIYQYQFNKSNDDLTRIAVAEVTDAGGSDKFEPLANTNFQWPDGIPNDGIPIEGVVTVSISLTVVYVILATAGLVFAIACLTFTYIFREKRLIRLTSPNLNYIIGLGAIILYLNVITFVIPTTNPDFVSTLCNINPWLTSLGYSLCYGTILVKMARVWIIFSRPLGLNIPMFKDYVMALLVLCLVVIDLVILGVYTLTEGLRGNLGVKLTSNREMPNETIGPTAVLYEYSVYVCESSGQVVLFAVLYGYKGLLQLIALTFAFTTRKVKVKGLDDSMYIAAAIYVTSIVLAVTIVSTYTLMDYVNVYPAVVGLGFLLGTTMILALVFVPRMVGLYKDPNGEMITFVTSAQNDNSTLDRSSVGKTEMRKLRRRINELENSLKQHTSSVVLSPPPDMPSPTIISDGVVEENGESCYNILSIQSPNEGATEKSSNDEKQSNNQT